MSDLLYYVSCCALTVGILIGIGMMSRVETAIRGNALSAVCTAAAVLVTLSRYGILARMELWLCLLAGLAVGLVGAYRVKMIEMPQVVALLNGFGGGASALVAVVSMLDGASMDAFSLATGGLALAIGMITLTGSLIAAGKLHKLIAQKPVIWAGHQFISGVALVLTAACVAAMPFQVMNPLLLVGLCTLCGGFFGIAFAIRVGGADMPITISLLNSFSGVAGSIAGMAIGDLLLVAVGGVVGASGLLLTRIMCRSMNRSLWDILLGKTSTPAKTVENTDPKQPPAVSAAPPAPAGDPAQLAGACLAKAKKVAIVPGYGMALAQAQDQVKRLADTLEAQGTEVLFAIHPVAGRMPGHMNVLLCEADVPYEKLHEMEEINPQFPDCDAVVIVGANDVVNPAANTAEGTPIYGMPVLWVEQAKQVIICNFDLKPGYAGVNNPLYTKGEGVTLLIGDAKDTLESLLAEIKV